MQTLTLNGVPVENYGLGVSDISTWLDIPARSYAAVQAPMRAGQIPLSTGSTIDTRALGLKFYVQPSSLTDRRLKLATLFGQLGGQLEISTIEDPTKVCYGFLTQAQTTSPFRPFLTPEMYSDLTLTCFDPLWYDAQPQMYGGTVAGNWCLVGIGGAPMRRMKFWIVGAATNPILILRRRQNTMEIQRMTFTVTLGANDYLEVDCDAYTITKYTAGVASSALSTLDPTQGFFFLDEPPSSFASDDIIATTSAGGLTVAYFRAYWG